MLSAIRRLGFGLDGIGVKGQRFVAGKGFEFLAHCEIVAFVRTDAVLDRDRQLAKTLARCHRLPEWQHAHLSCTGLHPDDLTARTKRGEPDQ